MDKNSKYKLGAIAIKYNVGRNTIVDILKENGFTDVKSNLNYVLSKEEYHCIDKLLTDSLEVRQKVIELRNEEITGKIINLLPFLVDLLNLNEKMKNFSYFRFPWKESEIKTIVKSYFDSLPKDILENIQTNNLVDKSFFNEIDSFLNKKEVVVKFIQENKIDNIKYYNQDYFEDGPYCEACMQSPCMCSDRERSSTVFDF